MFVSLVKFNNTFSSKKHNFISLVLKIFNCFCYWGGLGIKLGFLWYFGFVPIFCKSCLFFMMFLFHFVVDLWCFVSNHLKSLTQLPTYLLIAFHLFFIFGLIVFFFFHKSHHIKPLCVYIWQLVMTFVVDMKYILKTLIELNFGKLVENV